MLFRSSRVELEVLGSAYFDFVVFRFICFWLCQASDSTNAPQAYQDLSPTSGQNGAFLGRPDQATLAPVSYRMTQIAAVPNAALVSAPSEWRKAAIAEYLTASAGRIFKLKFIWAQNTHDPSQLSNFLLA